MRRRDEIIQMPFNPGLPYNDLAFLPPAQDVETKAILKKTIGAARALAELKQAGAQIPNPSILINTIPLLEARVSSEIENVVTTDEKLFQLALDENSAADSATKEALRYRTALAKGHQTISHKPVGTVTAVEVCRTIRAADIDVRTMPGTKIVGRMSGEIIYTPPEGEERIRKLLENWGRYVNERTDIDPLIRMAIMHYQFEAIHPFTDGNGRTGRILNILFLVQEGLLEIPVLYLSRYILQHYRDYYGLLRNVTENNEWEAWILYMLDAVEEMASWTAKRIHMIRKLHRHTRDHIRTRYPKIYSRDLVDLLFSGPFIRIDTLVKAGHAQYQTASKHLRMLQNIGVLKEYKVGRRKIFIHSKFWDLLLSDKDGFEPYPRA